MTKINCEWVSCVYNVKGKCIKSEVNLKHIDNDNENLGENDVLIQKLDCIDFTMTPIEKYEEIENMIPIDDKEIPF